MPESTEHSIVVDMWVVSEDNRDEFLESLVGLFERLRTLDGFLDGQILQGVNPTLFVSYATLRSEKDREAAFDDKEIQAIMRAIGGIARAAPHSYTVARSFKPAGD